MACRPGGGVVDPGLDVVEWARREHEITRHTRAARPVHRHQSRLDVAVARRRPAATHVDFLMASTKRTIVHERRGAPDWTGLGRRAVIRRVDRTSRSSCDRWSTAHRCAAPPQSSQRSLSLNLGRYRPRDDSVRVVLHARQKLRTLYVSGQIIVIFGFNFTLFLFQLFNFRFLAFRGISLVS